MFIDKQKYKSQTDSKDLGIISMKKNCMQDITVLKIQLQVSL